MNAACSLMQARVDTFFSYGLVGVRLRGMDRVRLGRALGYGARHAAKTLASAVDAATAPNPAGSATRTATRRPAENESVRQAAVPLINQVADAYRTVDETRKEAKKQAREAGRSMFAPLKTFSSVLWLQVTGTFFAVFAAFMGEGVWKLRANFRAPMNSPDAQKLYFHLIVFLAFAYFTVSNFVRASHRERKGRR
jgi:hypothetical protein